VPSAADAFHSAFSALRFPSFIVSWLPVSIPNALYQIKECVSDLQSTLFASREQRKPATHEATFPSSLSALASPCAFALASASSFSPASLSSAPSLLQVGSLETDPIACVCVWGEGQLIARCRRVQKGVAHLVDCSLCRRELSVDLRRLISHVVAHSGRLLRRRRTTVIV
jgi:hypothetical protein